MTWGFGDCQYRVVEGWGKGPEGRRLGIVSSIATDAQDRVYVIDREPNPAIVVFDRDGRLLDVWDQDFLKVPHSIWIGPDDRVLITDCQTHLVYECTLAGTVVQTWGTRDEPGAPGKPFNQPTWAVFAPWGDLYVADGYGQNWMHRFSANGDLLNSWGGTGSEPGQFDTPHCVKIDPRERVLVIDRGNQRIQVFDKAGALLDVWSDVLSGNELVIDANDIIHLAEAENRVSLLDLDGKVLGRWGEKGDAPGQFVEALHGAWMDSHEDFYICEVPFTPNRLQKFERIR